MVSSCIISISYVNFWCTNKHKHARTWTAWCQPIDQVSHSISSTILWGCHPLCLSLWSLHHCEHMRSIAAAAKKTANLFLRISKTYNLSITPSTPAVPNCCCSKGPAPYWSNPPFFNFWHSGALALRTERQSARMSKIKNGGLEQDQYGKV